MGMWNSCSRRWCLLWCLPVLIGCGDGIRIAPVQGTVSLDGKPLDKILVEFWPDTDGPRSFAETDSQGRFVLTTDDGKRAGAVVGTHKVTLTDASVLGDKFLGRAAETVDMTQGRKPRISVKLAGTDSTPLTQTVEAGKENNFEIKAERP